MGRLINTSNINNQVMMEKHNWGIFATDINNIIDDIVSKCPTADAIMIDDAKKIIEERKHDMIVNVMSAVNEDMIDMLTKLQSEIEETVKEEELIDKKWADGLHYSEKIIQQKINALTESTYDR